MPRTRFGQSLDEDCAAAKPETPRPQSYTERIVKHFSGLTNKWSQRTTPARSLPLRPAGEAERKFRQARNVPARWLRVRGGGSPRGQRAGVSGDKLMVIGIVMRRPLP